MTPRSIGIIGYGDFGRFLEALAKRYAPEIVVRVFSRSKEPDNERFFSLEDTAACDIVIIAVSIRAFEETLKKVLPLLSPESILVEVNTVKVMPVRLLRELAKGQRYIATHPMFGPYSFEKQGGSLEGLRLVIADHTLPDEAFSKATDWLSTLGLSLVTMTADEHDRMLAETLFLTHYIAQSVSRAGFVRTDIDTLSFGYLMDAVESVKEDTELFRDVYEFNPYCKEILSRLKEAEGETLAVLARDR
ncbi:MAG: arogenate dehydrogenase (NADP+), plant [Parcubacteria bacterium C7867-004]|nr:MAG: arogenate dehydrogenase (NADP+), plant [Parcubacteria bacterium C7867-004]